VDVDAEGQSLARHVLADRTAFVLIKLGEVVRSGAERTFAEIGLTGRQYDLMASVAADASLSQRDVGRLLGLAPNAIGAIVDDLEERGLIERTRSRADRRRHVLTLTRSGTLLLKRAHDLANTAEQTLLASLTAQQGRTLHELASRVLAPHWPLDQEQ
jgi:DNA-binding MarR family transcriptional regulator